LNMHQAFDFFKGLTESNEDVKLFFENEFERYD